MKIKLLEADVPVLKQGDGVLLYRTEADYYSDIFTLMLVCIDEDDNQVKFVDMKTGTVSTRGWLRDITHSMAIIDYYKHTCGYFKVVMVPSESLELTIKQ